MKTLAILGATGQTGLHLVAQALSKGHTVKALVRNEEKLKTALEKEQQIKEHDNLQIVKVSNIFDAEELKGPLQNVDVVMSTLGFGRGSTWTLLWFIGPILDNMRKAEEFLEGQEDIDYSFILPAGLSNGQATNCDFFAEEDSFCIGGKGGMIQRADVARYMIKTMEDDLHHKKIVAIHPKN